MRDSLVNALCNFVEMMLNDFLQVIVPVLLIMAMVFGGVIGFYAYVTPRTCAAKWADFDHRYTLRSGCQIKIDGRWVPTGNVKVSPATQSAAA